MSLSEILSTYEATTGNEITNCFSYERIVCDLDEAERACDDDTYTALLKLLGLSNQCES